MRLLFARRAIIVAVGAALLAPSAALAAAKPPVLISGKVYNVQGAPAPNSVVQVYVEDYTANTFNKLVAVAKVRADGSYTIHSADSGLLRRVAARNGGWLELDIWAFGSRNPTVDNWLDTVQFIRGSWVDARGVQPHHSFHLQKSRPPKR